MSSSVQEDILEARSQGYTLLYLNYRQLRELPEELLTLSKIRKLYLKRNVLRKLPADIWRLGNLVELYLHSNNLHELPDGIGKLFFLEKLDVCNNYLKTLSPAIGQLISLTLLHLVNNELSVLPKELGNLTNLRDLNVMNNKLEWLPWQLCNCTSLKILAFDGNAIQKIPRQLMRLVGLIDLFASRNKLYTLPQDVNNLCCLESVTLDHNTDLHLLPATLLKMENLKMIGLSGTAVESLQNLHQNDYSDLQKVLSLRHILDKNCSNVPPLTELCFRAVYTFVRSFTEENLSLLRLPSHVTNLLSAPTGHCFICCNPYFTAAFPLEESASTALRVVKPSAFTLQSLRDVQCSFVFCCCSRSCWDEVCKMRDTPD